jgi:outer membrane protein assembly factor BamB
LASGTGDQRSHRAQYTLRFVLAHAPARLLAPLAILASVALPAGGSEWPMWGGSPDRNMVSQETGLPESWDVGSGRNVRWTAELGSESYGNPVVAGGVVYLGTNNAGLRQPAEAGDRGVLLALGEDDGELRWQASFEKLETGAVNDWPQVGLCSSPLVEGERVYVVNNRAEVVALDVGGFRDGENDGPITDEPLQGPLNADLVWVFDMRAEVGSFPHNMAATSPLGYGDLIFVNTSNGHDESHQHIPNPEAPGLIALDKRTGELVWRDAGPGSGILHGQWSSASLGRVGDTDQVALGQGDGWVRAWAPLTGELLWEIDANPVGAVYPQTRNDVIATPVYHGGLVYVGTGQDPETGEGSGRLIAIDASGRGDLSARGPVWENTDIRRTLSTPAIHEGIVYYPDFSGFLHAFDAASGGRLWVHDSFAAVWGSPLVADGRVYLGDEDGDVVVLEAGREERLLAENPMGEAVYSTPVAAGGALFVMTRSRLFALALDEPPRR